MSEGPEEPTRGLAEVEILLVEDDPNDVELTMRALAKHHLANRVHVVNDGAAALDFLFAEGDYGGREAEHPPKVVLLDLKLPKVHGLDVLRRVKADDRTRDVPVVVLTSSRESPDVETSYQLGANSYIVKPVEFDDFIRVVSELGLYWLLINQPPRD